MVGIVVLPVRENRRDELNAMTLFAPDIAPTTDTRMDPRSLAPVSPSVPATRRQAAQTMVDLHFVVRERIADVLDTPRAATLDEVHAAVHDFLETERQLCLLDPTQAEDLGIDLIDLLRGRRAVRQALNGVAWSESGAFALARATEALRLAFLEHAARYSRQHPTATQHPSPTPIPLPAST